MNVYRDYPFVFYLTINVKIDKRDELEDLTTSSVRSLDEIIDHQKYPVMGSNPKYLQNIQKKFRDISILS